jgi:hypothetical protein
MSARQPDRFALGQLSRPNKRAYSTPAGVHLNATYIDFLRCTLPVAWSRACAPNCTCGEQTSGTDEQRKAAALAIRAAASCFESVTERTLPEYPRVLQSQNTRITCV